MQAPRCRIAIKQTRCTVPSLPRPQQRTFVPSHTCKASYKDEQQMHPTPVQQLSTLAASAIIAIAAVQNPLPATAALVETVPVSQMTQMAKPLPKQESIDKGKVWTVFIGGAASLFLLTVAAENNKSWFPAIARANEAMAVARKRAAEAENNPSAADIPTTAEPSPAAGIPAATAAAAAANESDELPPLEVESALIEAEIERRNALAAREAEALAAQAELARQQKLVEEGLLSAKKKVLNSDATFATTSKVEDDASLVAPAPAEHAESSSNGSSSSGAGYAVVAEQSSEQQAVAWQAEPSPVAVPAAVGEGVEGKTAVSAAALNGLLESRELMQQYREQQQQQQQQEVRQ